MPTPLQVRATALFELPLLDLVHKAATIHRSHHDPREIQCASLLSVKTGACPEDCSYCSQSSRNPTALKTERLMSPDDVEHAARKAKANGADRFCMGAAWREAPHNRQFDQVLDMVARVKQLGLETCATLGMVTPEQAEQLAGAGLDYYNHNLDTSPEFYGNVITTRTYEDRLNTLAAVRAAGMKVCCGGILGLGESRADRIGLLVALARQDPQPESVPINTLVAVEGTPLQDEKPIAWDEVVRNVAVARLLMPKAYVRLSAGRTSLSPEAQAMCFLAGANSVFLGDTLLTTPNCTPSADAELFDTLGLLPRAR